MKLAYSIVSKANTQKSHGGEPFTEPLCFSFSVCKMGMIILTTQS